MTKKMSQKSVWKLTAIAVEPDALPDYEADDQVNEQDEGDLPKRVQLLAAHAVLLRALYKLFQIL